MSNELNEIRLSADMIAMLYGTSLVQIPSIAQVAEKPVSGPRKTPRFLGENKKNITVLVNNSDHTFLPENELALLTKMLEACNVDLGDVAIVNTYGQRNAEPDIEELHPIMKLDFREHPDHELFSIRNDGGVEILNAPSLSRLAEESGESRQLKIRLWSSLKLLFGI